MLYCVHATSVPIEVVVISGDQNKKNNRMYKHKLEESIAPEGTSIYTYHETD